MTEIKRHHRWGSETATAHATHIAAISLRHSPASLLNGVVWLVFVCFGTVIVTRDSTHISLIWVDSCPHVPGLIGVCECSPGESWLSLGPAVRSDRHQAWELGEHIPPPL